MYAYAYIESVTSYQRSDSTGRCVFTWRISCGAKAQQTPPRVAHRGIARFLRIGQNVIRSSSSHGHCTPSLKISCKSVQPFSRNLADKETNNEIDRKQYPVPTVPGAVCNNPAKFRTCDLVTDRLRGCLLSNEDSNCSGCGALLSASLACRRHRGAKVMITMLRRHTRAPTTRY